MRNFPQKYLSTFFSALFRSFIKPKMADVFFHKRKAVNSQYQYAAFCGEHRTAITITNICDALKRFIRLATSIW